MSESLLSKLEASRKELLDLGMRNPLLNYRLSKARGVQLTNEKSEEIFDIIVRSAKTMSFIGKPDKEGTQEKLFEELSEVEQTAAFKDSKLQTNDTETALQNRLLSTYYAARTSIEEQGVNILFLAIGFLHWYESDNSEELRKAPLILIPVTLERSSAKEKFKLKYSSEEIGGNISLKAKLKNEFFLDLPDLPEFEDLNVNKYLKSVEGSIRSQKRWTVERDDIQLGFFSFGKFMIYNDLDNSKWPETKKPIKNNLLTQLFETGFSDSPLATDEHTHIDTETNADELFQVVDADSSQILTMLATHEGRNLVIQGPPGTGKSQTIANIIANAIGQGKKVLFVAEKMAALEVVKRRLDNIGIGDACLELHSHKANKKDLLEEIRRTMSLGRPRLEQLERQVAQLGDIRNELNEYCKSVNSKVGNSHLSTNQIIGYLLQINEKVGEIKLPDIGIENIENWPRERFDKAIGFAEKIEARLRDIGIPNKQLFWGIGLTILLPTEQEKIQNDIHKLSETLDRVLKTAKDATVDLGINNVEKIESIEGLIEIWNRIEQKPNLEGFSISNKKWLENDSEIVEMISAGKTILEIKNKYESLLIPEAWELDVIGLRANISKYGKKWFRFFVGSYRSSIKTFGAYCIEGIPKKYNTKLDYLDAILDNKRQSSVLKEYETLANLLFNNHWKTNKSDWVKIDAAYQYLSSLHKKIEQKTYPASILEYHKNNPNTEIKKQYKAELGKQLEQFLNCQKTVIDILKFDLTSRFGTNNIQTIELEHLFNIYNQWKNDFAQIHKIISWNTVIEVAKDEELSQLTTISSSWEYAPFHLKDALQKNWFEKLLNTAFSTYSALRKFERNSHEEVGSQFRKLDQLNFNYKRAQVAFKHWNELPKEDAGGQVNILKTEFNKKARHMPIRKLINEAGLAIQAVKPVFMMSPMSIANFIPPGILEFDIVVFDEASQVKPVDAIGAMLRGKQVIVVGDTKQLPPTSFFDTLLKDISDEDEDENVTVDMQSILGMCASKGVKERMLRWHYRSKHESLINVSNHEFYENKLIVFPSPGSQNQIGLFYHKLQNTAYDRGKTRTNPKEAEFVAQAAIEHARKFPNLTLGIVAFSSAQRQAIENVLELKRRANPDVEGFFRGHKHEPFFIKNLENVQGDERDVIFISIGYGKTAEGYLSMSFGPLNNEGGERRLNVLITRAKLRCDVFTNISSEDIDISRTNKFGVSALKNFLYYAEHGKLNMNSETGREEESPFEEGVAYALERHGYVVKKQIGSIGFYIDLAIVDPEYPGKYIIGIECDGASYHSSRSARDRDRLRQQILEANGWKLYRVWSTDWFRNPESELKKLILAIEKAKIEVDDTNVKTNEKVVFIPDLQREKHSPIIDEIPKYEFAKLSYSHYHIEIHEYPVDRLSELIENVVKKEGPVHIDEVAKRIIESQGIARVGSRIKDAILYTTNYAVKQNKIIKKGEFLWNPEMTLPIIRSRVDFPSSSKKIKLISPEEIRLAIEIVVKQALSIDRDNTAVLVCKMFGFNRTTEDMKYEIFPEINHLITNGILHVQGTQLLINKI